MATGGGKTHIFSKLARTEVTRGGRVLILVHRDELIRQARRKCESLGLWPDVEKGKQRASSLAKVVIASVQSLRSARLARWSRDHFTLVIVDEAHHASAKSYEAVLEYFREAKILGVTATPHRADGKSLGDVFESVAYTYDIRRAIAEQYLSPIVAKRVVVDSVDLREVDMRGGDFAQDQLAKAMADERALRGVVVPLLEEARDRLTIVFGVDVAHAQALAAVLNQHRPGCARAVSGETDDDEREHMLAAHTAGEFQFLVNCEICVEGYDSPPVSCVAMVRPTKSWARYVQAAGRGLRPSPETGKRDCLLLDFTGTSKHSLVGPADCLTGPNEIADDERAEIERLLGTGQLEIRSVMEQAKRETVTRRAAIKVNAIVNYHAENVDPFIGAGDRAEQRIEPSWTEHAPTEKQIAALEKQGVTLSKLPKGFSMADASRLLGQLASRHRAGLCSYKAAKRLSSAGVRDTTKLSHERARELLDKLRMGNWLPRSIANEPECRDAFPLRREA